MATINVEYINPFLMATVKVVKDACRLDVTVGKPAIHPAEFTDDKMLVLMGITGEMKGQAILDFPHAAVTKIASQMCMMTIDEVNELSQSAVCELCNMILGNTATLFSMNGVAIDITPPTVCTGNVIFSNNYAANINIPINFNGEKLFEINISVKGD